MRKDWAIGPRGRRTSNALSDVSSQLTKASPVLSAADGPPDQTHHPAPALRTPTARTRTVFDANIHRLPNIISVRARTLYDTEKRPRHFTPWSSRPSFSSRRQPKLHGRFGRRARQRNVRRLTSTACSPSTVLARSAAIWPRRRKRRATHEYNSLAAAACNAAASEPERGGGAARGLFCSCGAGSGPRRQALCRAAPSLLLLGDVTVGSLPIWTFSRLLCADRHAVRAVHSASRALTSLKN